MDNEHEERARLYYESRRKLAQQQGPQWLKQVDVLIDCLHDRYVIYNYSDKLREVLIDETMTTVSDVFAGDRVRLLELLLGAQHAAIFRKIWNRSTAYPYSMGYLRRSFRSNRYSDLYLGTNLERLGGALRFVASGHSWPEALLDREMENYEYLHDYIAYEIDEGNEPFLARLREIVYGDSNNAVVTRNIIKGLLMSRSREAHAIVGELLLAAKLQEGLRQTIAECMDEASREAFIYLLGLIVEQDLGRFSSIVRAFDVWTGLQLESQKPSVVRKCLKAAYECLANKEALSRCLNSEDSQLLYIGLWAVAFDELAEAEALLEEIGRSGPDYKRIAALQFVSQTQYPAFQHRLASVYIEHSSSEQVWAWALPNLFGDVSMYRLGDESFDVKELTLYEPCDAGMFERLREKLEGLPRKELAFLEQAFLAKNSLSADRLCELLTIIAIRLNDEDRRDSLLNYRQYMNPSTRAVLVAICRQLSNNKKQRQALIEALGDKSGEVRGAAIRIVEQLELGWEEYRLVENLLQYKAGDMRKAAIALLLKQTDDALSGSIDRLLKDKKEERRLGGLDLLIQLKEDQSRREIYKAGVERSKEWEHDARCSSSERILIARLREEEHEQFRLDNGFGLYNPSLPYAPPEPSKRPGSGLNGVLRASADEIKAILDGWSSLVHEHRNYEYEAENDDGGREKVVLGAQSWGLRRVAKETAGSPLDNLPLANIWRQFAQEQRLGGDRLLELSFYLNIRVAYGLWVRRAWERLREHYRLPATEKLLPLATIKALDNWLEKLPYRVIIVELINALWEERHPNERFDAVFNGCLDLWACIESDSRLEANVLKPSVEIEESYTTERITFSDVLTINLISFWINHLRRQSDPKSVEEARFKECFSLLYRFSRMEDSMTGGVMGVDYYARAFEEGLLPLNQWYAELLGRKASPDHLHRITADNKYDREQLERYPQALEAAKIAVDRIVQIELKRGDSDTPVSHLAQRINRFEGVHYFVECLLAIGNRGTFARGYYFAWGSGKSKKDMISNLLKSCHPAPGEDAESLRELLDQSDISDKKLIEAAMYAPQWIDIVEAYLGWKGLASACWYFHAHINQQFSRSKETVVARYSPIAPIDFNEGAFDIEWFREAYSTLGEKRFQIVYDSAKYISDGANHKRSQLFCDAVLGRLSGVELEAELSNKRNKTNVLCYGLIPFQSNNNKEELVHRYEVLQRFAKESKQFGSQRRDSEAKAVAIAIDNLARNAGYTDVVRMTWNVEAEAFKQMSSRFEPATIKEWQLRLTVDDSGKASVEIAKDGKGVKTIPAALKKEAYFVALKELQASLRDQHRRAKAALEQAMRLEEAFTIGELEQIAANKVIEPLIRQLVFKAGARYGFVKAGALTGIDGKMYRPDAEEPIIIAHPVHLYESGVWAAYQRHLFQQGIVQPFKQVFRELYRPNEDERLQGSRTERYAGHQIQPRKAAALLRSRGWTASYEEGLQKVYHRHNLIVCLYAMADWFTPAEVEAPTIQQIAFYERRTGAPAFMRDIPPVIFSEAMRDVDLVVSVAHVGGVDPEASLSTLEMRAAMVQELLPLLKLDNVKVAGAHVYIQGELGEYTVHLGSGVAHQMAAGALHIIPVHAQQRGRIFLPFADDDPRTAEIMSKVLMLAQDRKLKDPTILSQIKRS